MTTVTALPFSRPLVRADLEDLPDDGHRYELIDGVLLVSPGSQLPHQDVVGNLYLLLRAGCPADLKVVLAPFAVALSDDTELQPDLLVASYWLIDPDEPSAIVLELRDGTYEQVAHVHGSDGYDATLPFPVRLVPTELLD